MPSPMHLQLKREELQEQYDLLSEKIRRLRSEHAIQAGAAIRFQLEKEIERAEAERDRIDLQITDLDSKLRHQVSEETRQIRDQNTGTEEAHPSERLASNKINPTRGLASSGDTDSRKMLYLAIMMPVGSLLCLGCNILAYYGKSDLIPGASKEAQNSLSVPTTVLIVAGVILAALNSIAANSVSSLIYSRVESLPKVWRYVIVMGVFLISLGLSVWVAILLGR